MKLPLVQKKGKISVEEAIAQRRSNRDFSSRKLTLVQCGQLLWAGQGITDECGGLRSCPSAGATYPLELYLVAGEVDSLRQGIYHYLPQTHSLDKIKEGDFRKQLALASLHQASIVKAPVDLLIAGDYRRTMRKYGERGRYYVHLEVGHCCQNILLQATALGLSAVPVGAFEEDSIKKIVSLPDNLEPFYIIPVGYKKSKGKERS